MKKHCNDCKRNITPVKKFNWGWFLGGLLTFGIISTLYLIYFIVKGKNVCPICNGKDLAPAKD